MSKEEIINIIKEKLDAIEDVDDKVDALAELMNEYYDHKDFDYIITKLYSLIKYNEDVELEDPRVEELYSVLDSTNELLMNEKYEEVINLLVPFQSFIDEMTDISNIDLGKLEVCSFFNEIEKQMYFYRLSDPNKDIHLINPVVSQYYSCLSICYHQSSDFNNAIKCYKEILKFNPCSNMALFGMAYIAYVQDNYLTCLEYLKELALYAFSSELIFEAYQLLTNIYIQYCKYDYAALFAYIGSSFAPSEELENTMLDIYGKYKDEIKFDINNEEDLDNHLLIEEFKYMPNDDVMDVLYTMLLDFKAKPELKDDYLDLAEIILSLVDDEELEKDVEKIFKELN